MSIVLNNSNANRKQIGWRRSRDSGDDDAYSETSLKRPKYSSWYVRLESESPLPTDEDDESVYTVQGNETEFARDTSDTSTHTWVSSDSEPDDVSIHVEYEVDSQSDGNENVHAVETSSSEPENVLSIGFVATNTDVGDFADDSDNSTSTSDESQYKRINYWDCIQCKNKNNNPSYRYCQKCYSTKKSNFCRTRRKRKKRTSKSVVSNSSQETSTLGSQELVEMDSGIASSQEFSITSSQSLTLSQLSTFSESEAEKKQHINGNLAIPKTNQNITVCQNDQSGSDGLCLFCQTNPKDGIFVHCRTSHICSCYKCAKKVWRTNNMKCPMCQRKVTQVLKAYWV